MIIFSTLVVPFQNCRGLRTSREISGLPASSLSQSTDPGGIDAMPVVTVEPIAPIPTPTPTLSPDERAEIETSKVNRPPFFHSGTNFTPLPNGPLFPSWAHPNPSGYQIMSGLGPEGGDADLTVSVYAAEGLGESPDPENLLRIIGTIQSRTDSNLGRVRVGATDSSNRGRTQVTLESGTVPCLSGEFTVGLLAQDRFGVKPATARLLAEGHAPLEQGQSDGGVPRQFTVGVSNSCPDEAALNVVSPMKLDTYDGFGEKVAISETYAAVSSPGDDGVEGGPVTSNVGAVYTFTQNSSGRDGQWVMEGKLIGPEAQPGDAISSVALSGGYLAFGSSSHRRKSDQRRQGMVWLYRRTGSQWTYLATLAPTAPNPSGLDDFGASVSIGRDRQGAEVLFVGAPGDGDATTASLVGSGAIYVFNLSNLESGVAHKLKAARAYPFHGLGKSVSGGNGYVAGGAPMRSNQQGVVGPGSVSVFSGAGTSWTEIAKLKMPGDTTDYSAATYSPGPLSLANSSFGRSVATDFKSRRILVGAPNSRTREAGSAFVFTPDGNSWSWNHVKDVSVGKDLVQGGDEFGNAVSIFGDDLVVSAWKHNEQTGAIYQIKLTGNNNEISFQKIRPRVLQKESRFGSDVGLFGGHIVVGATLLETLGSGTSLTDTGGAYVIKALSAFVTPNPSPP